jgi:hypothetical protein
MAQSILSVFAFEFEVIGVGASIEFIDALSGTISVDEIQCDLRSCISLR